MKFLPTYQFRLFMALLLIAGLFSPIFEMEARAAASHASLATPKTSVNPAVTSNLSNSLSAASATNPVLLVYNNTYLANSFGPFLGEIMKAEGYNLFDTAQLADVTQTTLASYDSVVLAQTSLTSAQASMFSQYVQGGGNLIAMRPDAQLASVFGLGTPASTLSNSYIGIQTNSAYGQGFPSDSIQTHTTADQYNSVTSQVVALLYNNASTATTYPAVVVNNYGNGKAAAFTYDLASAVVYLRQGNPTQADVDADGDGVVRIVDMYYNWIDLNKMSLPQADLHQRLFGRILEQFNNSKKPLPRFWYFPNGKNTAVVLTSDAHGNPDSYYANLISSMSNYSATTTFYMSQASQPSASNVANWQSQGYGFSTHPYEIDTPLATGYDNVDSWFDLNYGTRTSRTVRVHRVQWQGWVDGAKIGAARGYAMDYTYYRYGAWLLKGDGTWARGYMTGSGLPMKLIDQNGQIVDNFGQYTTITDDQMLAAGGGPEGLNATLAYQYTKQAIDASEAGDNQALAMQMHVDYYAGEQTWAESTLSYTRNLNIPMFSGDKWLEFTENRYNSALSTFNWSGNQLSFSASVPATQTGQTVVLPVYSATGDLSSVTVNGAPATYTTKVIRGETSAFVVLPAGTSNVVATYIPDTTPPVISNLNVTASPNQAQVSWTTNELADSKVNYGTTSALGSSVTGSGYVNNHTLTLSGLSGGVTYYYQVVSKDQNGNTASSTLATFTTPAGQLIQNTYAQFASGTFSNTASTAYSAGEVKLKSPLEDTFAGTSLDTQKWTSGIWASGGSNTVSGGKLTSSGAYVQSQASLPLAGRSISANLKFTPGVAFQHFGPSPDLSSSWFLFSLPGSDPNNLYARTNFGSTVIDQKLIGVDLTQFHDFKIEFVTGQVNYYVDGILQATHNISTPGSMPVWISSPSTAGPIQLDWLRYNSYPASGTFVSTPFDAGTAVSWASLNWAGSLNGGNVQVQTRSSGDAVNWTAWSTANSSSTQTINSPVGRYLQYQLTFSTPDSATSPVVSSVAVNYNPVQVDHVSLSPSPANVVRNQSVQFSATGYDAANNTLPGLAFSWSVVNGGGVIDASGLFTGTVNGTFTNTVVASSGGKSAAATVTVVEPAPPPTLTAIAPSQATTSISQTVTLTGTNFVSGASVKLGTLSLGNTSFISTTRLTTVVPAGTTPGTYNLTVTNPDGQSATLTNAYTVLPPSQAPTISQINSSPVSNVTTNTVIIKGANFQGPVSVALSGTVQPNAVLIDSSNISLPLVANFAPGTYDVQVTNGDGQNVTLAGGLVVLPRAIIQNSKADFSGGTFTSTVVLNRLGGEVKLPATLEDYFEDSTLDSSQWVTDVWGAGGSANLSGGQLVVSGAYARSANNLPVTRLQGRIKFLSGYANQHFGFSPDLSTSWILFSIPGFDTNHLYARTNINGLSVNTQLNVTLDTYHDFVIVIGNGTIQYYVDGTLLTTDTVNAGGSTYVWLSSGNPAAGLALDSVTVGTYPASGTYTSSTLDGGNLSTWSQLYWQANLNGGSASIQARTSMDGSSWSSWSSPVNSTGYVNLTLPPGRYLQYQLNLGTSDPTQSPEVLSVAALYSAYQPGPVASIKVSPASVNLGGGATQQFSAQGYDSNNIALSGLSFSWSTTGGGTINSSSGLYTAGYVGGSYPNSIIATSSTITGSASVTITTPAPAVSDMSPNSGGTLFTTPVTISGTNFVPGTTAKLGTTALSNVVVVSGSQLTAVVPSGMAAGSYTLTVTNPDNQAASLPNAFTVQVLTPTVSSVSPASGNNAITRTLTITGTNFAPTPTVQLGTTNLSSVSYISSTQLTAQVSANFTVGTYTLSVRNSDGQTGSLASAYTVTAAPSLSPTMATVCANGTFNNTLCVDSTASGSNVAVGLLPVFQDGFTSTTLNTTKWATGAYVTGGAATIAGSLVTVKGSYIRSSSTFTQSVVEGRVKFSNPAGANQNFGWATDLSTTTGPWAVFGVPTTDTTGVYARTNLGGTVVNTKITTVNFNTYYNFKIVMGASTVKYFVNNTLVATHNATTTTALRVYLSSSSTSNNNLQADWLQVSSYPASGDFTSSTIDAGSQVAAWGIASWAATVPAGTTLALQTQTSVDGVTWSTWSDSLSSSGSLVTSPPGRYIRYKLLFTSSTDPTLTPSATSVSLIYTLN